jgi:ferredoxin
MSNGKYEVDPSACIRCGSCATGAPAIFSLRAGPAKVVRQPETESESRACEEAVRLCPSGAVRAAEPWQTSGALGAEKAGPGLYPVLAEVAESARWKLSELPWSRYDPGCVSSPLRALVKEMAFHEHATYSATQRFMQAFADDTDFTQWVSVWFYEETRHPTALMRWLALSGETLEADFVARGRVSTPFMKSRTGTLVTNIISEMVGADAYLGLSVASSEPLLTTMTRQIAADEARHAASFYRFARRRIVTAENPERERLDSLKVLHFWLNEQQSVSHPVSQTMARLAPIRLEAGLPAEFQAPRERICRAIAMLTDLPIASPADVFPLLAEQTARVHAEA